jgi:hypothetical protein
VRVVVVVLEEFQLNYEKVSAKKEISAFLPHGDGDVACPDYASSLPFIYMRFCCRLPIAIGTEVTSPDIFAHWLISDGDVADIFS